MIQLLWKNVWQFLKKLNIDVAILLLAYPTKINAVFTLRLV